MPAPRQNITGICPPARAYALAHLIRTTPASLHLIVVPSQKLAEQLAEDLPLFLPTSTDSSLLLFPESLPDSQDMREAFTASADRLAALSQLRSLKSVPHSPSPIASRLILLTTPAALAQPVPALPALAQNELTIRRGQTYPHAAFLEKLLSLDYDSEALCESPGHYAIRGGIIDVYPVTADRPYRLDFFGDEIESIHAFDPVTQRSLDPVEAINLTATPRLLLEPTLTGLADYLPAPTHLILLEPAAFPDSVSENSSHLFHLTSSIPHLTTVSDLDEDPAFPLPAPDREETWDTESLSHHRRYPSDDLIAQDRLQAEESARAAFLVQLRAWSDAGARLHIVFHKDGEEKRIREILTDHPKTKKLRPAFHQGSLNEGFRIARSALLGPPGSSPASEKIPAEIFITETELFGRQRTRRPAPNRRATVNRAQIDQLLDFSELVEGDYVVHLQHGIAHYRGLTKLEHAGGAREAITLEFDDHITLHVPLQESHLISRYVGLSKTRPQLGRIGSGRWEKARQAAERSTLDLAAELLRIHAARETQLGHACPPDTEWQKEFEGSFPYTETPDQLRAINDTKADLERTRPMDRLICGDVGFGKTEVAIRAAFKAVQSGRQVALLVPTTILAQQHLNTFRERMAGYPVAVELLSRYRTRAEQSRILAATTAGQVDILIGTHRLLQDDVKFHELGLVIIDEEQRFGVKHKERFRQLRATLDVLAMSATPIPRTLYMALTGARDMSVIETAPINRLPIQTIVKTYDEKIVVDAVRHEVARGGQVFYLHNRVQTIDLTAARLRQLLPDLNIGVGHGQMAASDLERLMTDFVAGQYHVLVCTTIIESGLDIPNCNTILIEGADRFGLSQLYQLRGRVGRFKHQAYAYLLLHRHTRLVEIARQRLNAMRSHNQLGAGFRIAMRDLELRGAGNLLGAEQSGHIVGVGFELYCQLLRQSVARLKGEKNAVIIRANVKIDFISMGDAPAPDSSASRHTTSYSAIKNAEDTDAGATTLDPVPARLPASYIAETRLRLDLYRRLALADTPARLKEIDAELRDRFGKYPDDVKHLLLVTEIRIRAEQKGILSVETEATRLKCLRNSGRRDDFVMVGTRFPRLTGPRPHLRLREIISFLNNLPTPQ